MATSTPLIDRATNRSTSSSAPRTVVPPQRLLIYWHLFSLDAPTVAMLWTWFIAKSSGIHLPATAILAMGTAVWLLYAADRLLDSRTLFQPQLISDILSAAASRGLETRHIFHHRHRRAFRIGIVLATLALSFMVPQLAPQSIRLDLVLGTLLIAYFALIHLQRNPAPRLPKEIAVGIFFCAATFIPTIARNPALRGPLLPSAIFFGVACSLNCLFIYAWEHPYPFSEAHPATRLTLRFLRPLACLAILGSLTLALRSKPWPLPCAIALSVSLLLLLHRNRRRLDPATLRAAADLCLLTPVLFAFNLPA